MDFETLIERLIKYAPNELESKGYWMNTGRCIISTRVGCEVLNHYGYKAEPIVVMVRAANKLYLNLADKINKGKISVDEALARGVKLIEIDIRTSAASDERWPGHLIVGVPAQDVVLDLDVVAFNRPSHDLILPRAASMHVSKDWWEGHKELYYPLDKGAMFQLTRLLRYHPFDHSPDWTKLERWSRIVRAIIKRIDNA